MKIFQSIDLFQSKIKHVKNNPEFENLAHIIGPQHDSVTWYRISYAGTQIMQWEFKTKEGQGWNE